MVLFLAALGGADALALQSKRGPLAEVVHKAGLTVTNTKEQIGELKLFAKDVFKGLPTNHEYPIPVLVKGDRLVFSLSMRYGRVLELGRYPLDWHPYRWPMMMKLDPNIFMAAEKEAGVTTEAIKAAITETVEGYRKAHETMKTMRQISRVLKYNDPPLTMPISIFDGLIQYKDGRVADFSMRQVLEEKYPRGMVNLFDVVKEMGISSADLTQAVEAALAEYIPKKVFKNVALNRKK